MSFYGVPTQERPNITNDTIVFAEVGSRAHGCNVEGSDRDWMGVFVESPEQVMGLHWKEHLTDANPHSAADDTTLYSLRKFAKLASTVLSG